MCANYVSFKQRINTIHDAIRNNDLETVQTVVTAKKWAIARNRKGLTPVHNAVLHKDSRILEFLVMAYPDVVNSSDYSLKTPLHYAAVYGKNNQFYRFLLAAGADPSVTDSENHNPEYYMQNPIDLHLTVMRDHYIVSGSDFDLSNSESNEKLDPLMKECELRLICRFV
ncbi:unnamed protein product [Soboliphyme baturini]|uniref:ANK_REP_REGION domain-containing protein n=1 Tax=Soboliphyme baturini TaxID=241478 RepID=A0A183J6C9_9BILA|nr:unnamed protein product [Soboliphyme baturini]